jgi:hypothetical protein
MNEMTKTPTNTGVFTYQGKEVRILGRDSDPSAMVWICFVGNPDYEVFVSASELLEAK